MDIIDLEKPLDPDLDYFDATPSIEECVTKIKELHGFIEWQLDINNKVLLALQDMSARVTALEGKKSGLIVPERFNS